MFTPVEQRNQILRSMNLLFLSIILKGSWDSYIDNLIAQSKDRSGKPHVDKACIIGLDGGAKWTTDGHPNALKLSANEAVVIAQVFKSGDFTPFKENGVQAEETSYNFQVKDGKLVFAKKKGLGGLALQSSKTAVVIAHCPEGSQQGNANEGVQTIADYLESINM